MGQYLKYTKENEGGKNNGPYYDPKKRRWFDIYGQQLQVGKGYYSKRSNTYQQYNTDGTLTRFTPELYAHSRNKSTVRRRKELERKYAIPIKKPVKLTKAGKATGAVVSYNLLDSIAKYGKEAGIPLVEALGVSNKESTLGNGDSRGVGYFYGHPNNNGTWNPEILPVQAISPVLLTSDWSYINDNPYAEYITSSEALSDALVLKEAKARNKPNINRYDIGRNYFLKQEASFNINLPPLLHSFLLHKSGKYNTNEPNYMLKVIQRGKELLGSPEILQWLATSEYAY